MSNVLSLFLTTINNVFNEATAKDVIFFVDCDVNKVDEVFISNFVNVIDVA